MTKKVLVVEDDSDSRSMMKAIVELCGHSAIVAENGHEAIELAQQAQPDLIFMDIGLPKIDGISATRTIKSSSECEKIPVVAVTAFYDLRETAIEAGCCDVVDKPIEISRISQAIFQHLG